jgi:thymidylate synthase
MNTHEEYQYLNLIKNILENGYLEEGRNGKTKSIFGSSMRFSLKNGKIPILTTKKVAWKTCLKELLWFIRGETNNKLLQAQNVHIWDGNGSKEFKKNIGLEHYPEGILGTIYGYQWRHFNAPYDVTTGNVLDENKPGIDQLQYIIEQLKNPETRSNRRLIMTAWNPCQLNKMVLPPCHVMCQFNVHDGNKLSCAMYQRSVDVPIGSPFNIASYSFLTHLLAKHCDLEPFEFIYFMGNCHIYEEHLETIKTQIERIPYEFPTLEVIIKRENINDYIVDDFKINSYTSHDAVKMKMVA